MATYLILNCIVIAVLVPGLILRKHRPSKAWWTALAGLLVLTAVFDNVIIGLNIVGYNPSRILGIHIGLVPIEDFFYAIVAALIVPALWKRGDRHE